MAAIDADPDVRRVVHLGDIMNGSSVCSDDSFARIRADFYGIDRPADTTLSMVRTLQETDDQPLSPLCPDGSRARPVNCRPHPKGGYPICDWICP